MVREVLHAGEVVVCQQVREGRAERGELQRVARQGCADAGAAGFCRVPGRLHRPRKCGADPVHRAGQTARDRLAEHQRVWCQVVRRAVAAGPGRERVGFIGQP